MPGLSIWTYPVLQFIWCCSKFNSWYSKKLQVMTMTLIAAPPRGMKSGWLGLTCFRGGQRCWSIHTAVEEMQGAEADSESVTGWVRHPPGPFWGQLWVSAFMRSGARLLLTLSPLVSKLWVGAQQRWFLSTRVTFGLSSLFLNLYSEGFCPACYSGFDSSVPTGGISQTSVTFFRNSKGTNHKGLGLEIIGLSGALAKIRSNSALGGY